jgi:ferredoxin
MKVIVTVDHDTCVGYGECVAADPEAVELGEDGCARVVAATLDEERALEICNACPVSALALRPAA